MVMNICRNYSKSEAEILDDRVLRVKKSNAQLWYSEHLPKSGTMKKMQINDQLSKEIPMENAVQNIQICLQKYQLEFYL